jgi:hypothetical protein
VSIKVDSGAKRPSPCAGQGRLMVYIRAAVGPYFSLTIEVLSSWSLSLLAEPINSLAFYIYIYTLPLLSSLLCPKEDARAAMSVSTTLASRRLRYVYYPTILRTIVAILPTQKPNPQLIHSPTGPLPLHRLQENYRLRLQHQHRDPQRRLRNHLRQAQVVEEKGRLR